MKEHHKPIWVFTPSRTDPADLEFILVQRQALLQDAVERVRESALTKHKHHLLFVGPRGCGKTHLITLLVSRLSQHDDLSDRLRIAWLNEDETCTTLLELFLKIHGALEKRYPDEFRSEDVDEAFDLKPEAALAHVSSRILAALGDRTLLLLVENLDAVFEAMGDPGQKQLRAFVQENPRFCIVATAQRLVEDLSKRISPFFGFFQTEHLKPLNVEEATELLKNIARLHGQDEVVKFLSTSRGRSRVRALHHLSGGNHRIYIVLSQFITRDSIDALLGPFMKMVDELTPYYQERVRWLPPMQRKIVEFLCVCESTVPVKAIAKRLFTTPPTISSQLQSLREKGYVEASQRGRESLYEVSEPLMRICVEVKENQSNQPLRLLVDFLRVWYDDRELIRRLGHLESGGESNAYLTSAIERNSVERNLRKKLFLADLALSLPEEMSVEERNLLLRECEDAPEAVAIALRFWVGGDESAAISCLNEAVEEDSEPDAKAFVLLTRGRLYTARHRANEAIKDFTAVIELPNAPVEPVAWALFNRGVRHGQAGETQREIEDYTAVIELPNVPVEAAAMALVNRGVTQGQTGETHSAIEDYTTVIELSNAPVDQIAKAFNNRGVAHGQEGETQRAIEDYTAVIELPNAPIELVAMALGNRGTTRGKAGESRRAIEDFTAVAELPDAPVEQVARALFYRGVTHRQAGENKRAIEDFTAVIERNGGAVSIRVDANLALSGLLIGEGRWSEGMHALDLGLEFGVTAEPPYFGSCRGLIGVLFSAGLSPEARLARVTEMLGLYEKHDALAELGEGVVEQIGEIYRAGKPFPSTDNLAQWGAAWETAAAELDEFRLPLRLLKTGINYLKAEGKSPEVLLDLRSAEREILRQALGLNGKNSR